MKEYEGCTCGADKDQCIDCMQYYIDRVAEATDMPNPYGSTRTAGSATMPGLTEAEAEEYQGFLIMHIGEVSQEDWLRFHALNDKYIEALNR